MIRVRLLCPAKYAGFKLHGQDLDRTFSEQHKRTVAQDNTVRLGDRTWQIERLPWRGTLAGCRVTLCEHLDQTVSILYGPHFVGRYTAAGQPLQNSKKARGQRCGNDAPRKTRKTQKASLPLFPPRLEIRQSTPDSHIPTAPTAAARRNLRGRIKIKTGQITYYKNRTS